MEEEQKFRIIWPPNAKVPGQESEVWIGIKDGRPKPIPCPFDMQIRRDGDELVCVGLRVGSGVIVAPSLDRNITRRDLVSLPIIDVLRHLAKIGESRSRHTAISRVLPDPMDLALPLEGSRARPGPEGLEADFLVQAAEDFNADYEVTRCAAETYRNLAARRNRPESTVRRWVRKGWEIRPELRPEGIRTRRMSKPGGLS
jgi:hypothetical protein